MVAQNRGDVYKRQIMKIAEIREIATNELAERIEAEVANYNQMVLNHSISPLDNPAQIKKLSLIHI